MRRQDDNGQVFTVRAFQARFNAEAWARSLEAEPRHKQLSWVEHSGERKPH